MGEPVLLALLLLLILRLNIRNVSVCRQLLLIVRVSACGVCDDCFLCPDLVIVFTLIASLI